MSRGVFRGAVKGSPLEEEGSWLKPETWLQLLLLSVGWCCSCMRVLFEWLSGLGHRVSPGVSQALSWCLWGCARRAGVSLAACLLLSGYFKSHLQEQCCSTNAAQLRGASQCTHAFNRHTECQNHTQ